MSASLSLTASVHEQIYRHLFPGDGFEAAAILLCSRVPGPRVRLLARDLVLVPHEACKQRQPDYLVWPGAAIEDAIDRAETDDLSLVLIHSHPGGLFAFSQHDDESDRLSIPGLFQALGSLHGTAIMIPGGAILARLYQPNMNLIPIDMVSVAGNDLLWWWADGQFAKRPIAFTSETRLEMSRLSACVVGISGTGSIVAEQLARLGFGKIILIDFDNLEEKNLNRILNSTLDGAAKAQPKVYAFADAITRYRGEGVAVPLAASIATREAVLLASQSDVIFSCVDTLDARQIVDLIASAFMIPLFDVGVSIPYRKAGASVAVADVCGRIDYVQPGGSTLHDRGVYGPESLRAEYLGRVAPDVFQAEVNAGYLKGISEQAPSVISLNMRAAAACVMEFIARAYPFRHNANEQYARTEFSLAANEDEFSAEVSFEKQPNLIMGRGQKEPLLGLPAMRELRKKGAP
jgi:hypothetical protein